MKNWIGILSTLSLVGAIPTAAIAQIEDLEAIRAATEKYQDVNVALADGFIPDPSGACVSAAHEGLPAEWGAMGIHYLHPGRLGITQTEPEVDGNGTHTDFVEPAILLYEPQEDGSLVLVGLENLVWQEAWQAAGNEGPPTFRGRPWDAMADDPATDQHEAHGFMPHFDQHVWLFREAPEGGEMLPFNPNVSCEHHHSDH